MLSIPVRASSSLYMPGLGNAWDGGQDLMGERGLASPRTSCSLELRTRTVSHELVGVCEVQVAGTRW